MALRNTRGAFTEKDYATAAAVIIAADKDVVENPTEGMILAPYFKKYMFHGQGNVKYYFFNDSEIEVAGDYGYVGDGDAPISVAEYLTTKTVTLKPKVYFSADVSIEALGGDPLADTLSRNLAVARRHIVGKVNEEMTDCLLANARSNSDTPQTGDGSYWFNSSDAGDNLPQPYGAHTFATHSVNFVYTGTTTTTALNGHVETTSTNMTMNLDHLRSIREHILHHGYGKDGPIHCICSYAVSRELQALNATDASGSIPENVYEKWFKSGNVVGQVEGFILIINEWIPSPLALFIDPEAKPATWLVQFDMTVVDVSQTRNLTMGTGIYYRGGCGILKRGAGYVGNFDL